MKRYLILAVATVVTICWIALPAGATNQHTKQLIHKQQIRYYHADGFLKAIGHVAYRTIYSSHAPTRWKWTRTVHRLVRVRSDARAKIDQLRMVTVNDWITAVQYVQRWYPGSSGWLISCSNGEGGHGHWVPNRSGSGAGGWMQYMEGTFWTDYHGAVQDLRSRGIHVSRSTASWYNPLGQAIASGWAYYHSRPAGKWLGAGC